MCRSDVTKNGEMELLVVGHWLAFVPASLVQMRFRTSTFSLDRKCLSDICKNSDAHVVVVVGKMWVQYRRVIIEGLLL